MKQYIAVNIVSMGLLVALLAGSPGQTALASVVDDARSESWQAEDVKSLQAFFAERTVVQAFMAELLDWSDEFSQTVCENELTDLNHDGALEMIVTVDHSGRLFCNEIIVVAKARETFRTSSMFVGGASVDDLKWRIRDLNRDGMKELLVPRPLAPYDGANPIPIIDDVYQWDGAKLHRANASFKDYYRRVLPRLESKLDEARQGRTGVDPADQALLERKYVREIEEVRNMLAGAAR